MVKVEKKRTYRPEPQYSSDRNLKKYRRRRGEEDCPTPADLPSVNPPGGRTAVTKSSSRARILVIEKLQTGSQHSEETKNVAFPRGSTLIFMIFVCQPGPGERGRRGISENGRDQSRKKRGDHVNGEEGVGRLNMVIDRIYGEGGVIIS